MPKKQTRLKPKIAKLKLIAVLKSLLKNLPAHASQKPKPTLVTSQNKMRPQPNHASQKPKPMLVTSQNKMRPQPNQQRKNRQEKRQKKHQQKSLMQITPKPAPITGHPPMRQQHAKRSVQPRKMLSKLAVARQNHAAADGGHEVRQSLPL